MRKHSRWLILSICLVLASLPAALAQQEAGTPKKKPFLDGLNPFKGKKPRKNPTPTPTPTPSPTATPSPQVPDTAADLTSTPSPTPRATPKPKSAPNATIASEEIADFESNPPVVRGIIETALGLTSLNLDYRYGSADPANGGMDGSGFTYFVLTKTGISNVPRDARDQYVWVRKAGNFQTVLAQSDDTFELDGLQPGDLLFWANMQASKKEPAITETMIYLGREKASGRRIMVGASEGRIYKGQLRKGVSILDFKPDDDSKSDDENAPRFVGYGRVPNLPER